MSKLRLLSELRALLNRESVENQSGTPDFILAAYMLGCLKAYEQATKDRDAWYDFTPMCGSVPARSSDDTQPGAPRSTIFPTTA